jgi:hypothetical protein
LETNKCERNNAYFSGGRGILMRKEKRGIKVINDAIKKGGCMWSLFNSFLRDL